MKNGYLLGEPSYVFGTWRKRGVWWYYIAGLAVKMACGTLALLLMSMAFAFKYTLYRARFALSAILPMTALLVLVSSQTGLNVHLRYVFPVLPLRYITASAIASVVRKNRRSLAAPVGLLLLISSSEGVLGYPDSLAYTNWIGSYLSGDGPALLGSSLDWGQDVNAVQIYYRDSVHPRSCAYAPVMQITTGVLVESPGAEGAPHIVVVGKGETSWKDCDYVAVSLNRLYGAGGEFHELRTHSPVCRIGRTTAVFRLFDANIGQTQSDSIRGKAARSSLTTDAGI